MFRFFCFFVLVIFLIACSVPSRAQDAQHCIVVETAYNHLAEKDAMSIYNNCEYDVYVHWCHDGTGNSKCGGDRYFTQSRILESKERAFNQFSLPTGPTIRTAACFGRSSASMYIGDTPKGYGCKPQGPVAACPDGEKKSFTWETMYANDTYTFIRVTSGDLTSWIRLENPMYDILDDRQNAIGGPVADRLCGEVKEQTLSSKATGALKNEVKAFFDERRAACLADATSHSNCEVYRNPSKILMTTIGVRN